MSEAWIFCHSENYNAFGIDEGLAGVIGFDHRRSSKASNTISLHSGDKTMTSLTEMAQKAVLESDIPTREIAARVGKRYSTLMREINPYDEGAKMSAETLVEIMRVTGDISALELMAKRLGYRLELID